MAVLIPDKFIYLSTPHTASIATPRALATLEGIRAVAERRFGKEAEAFGYRFPD